MSAHTAGPWEACGNYVRQARSHSAGQEVARIDFSASHFDAETRAANTMLIAAAPSLLEALKTAEHEGSCDCPPVELQTGGRGHLADCWTAVVRAAIAKAEGRAS